MRRRLISLAVASAVLVSTTTVAAGVFPGDDGKIAYSRPSGIWTVDPDGTDAVLLIPDGFSPAWSPDGSRIAYVRFGPDFADIYVADADGSNEAQITRSGENLEPTFSADGSRVIFVRSGGRTDIASKAADGTGPLTGSPTHRGSKSCRPPPRPTVRASRSPELVRGTISTSTRSTPAGATVAGSRRAAGTTSARPGHPRRRTSPSRASGVGEGSTTCS